MFIQLLIILCSECLQGRYQFSQNVIFPTTPALSHSSARTMIGSTSLENIMYLKCRVKANLECRMTGQPDAQSCFGNDARRSPSRQPVRAPVKVGFGSNFGHLPTLSIPHLLSVPSSQTYHSFHVLFTLQSPLQFLRNFILAGRLDLHDGRETEIIVFMNYKVL